MLPKRGTVFQDGDLVYVAVADARLAEVEAILGAPHRRAMAEGMTMRVAIAGAGNVGRSIAAELMENGHEVLLIDQDPRAIKSDSGARAPSGCWPTPASCPPWRRPASTPATWRSPPPATTRPTW